MKVNSVEPTLPVQPPSRPPRAAREVGVSEGQVVVELIENAHVPAPESEEKGTHINTVA